MLLYDNYNYSGPYIEHMTKAVFLKVYYKILFKIFNDHLNMLIFSFVRSTRSRRPSCSSKLI